MATKAIIFDLFKTLGEFEWTITDESVSSLLRGRGYEIYPQLGDTHLASSFA